MINFQGVGKQLLDQPVPPQVPSRCLLIDPKGYTHLSLSLRMFSIIHVEFITSRRCS